MLKTFFFLILFVMLRPVSAASLMTHEQFVHLPQSEQKQIVIGMMELIVEIEGRYKHETKTAGFSAERFRQYSQIMRKLSSFLIEDAEAEVRRQRYGQFLTDLRGVLRQRNRCLYGGWISTVGGSENLCTHPSQASAPEVRSMYQSERDCTGRNSISCNPAIFGFRNVQTKTLFCVPAGRVGSSAPFDSDNSSRACMLKALSTTAEAGTSSREDRLQNIINGISLNPIDANNTFAFMIKTCACAADTPEIANNYHNYMRPHRTCYSILRMMAEYLPSCQTAGQRFLNDNQMSFLNHIKTAINDQQMRQTNFEDAYRPIVDQFVSRPDYQAICGTQPPATIVVGPAACTGGSTRATPEADCKCADGSVPPAGGNCPAAIVTRGGAPDLPTPSTAVTCTGPAEVLNAARTACDCGTNFERIPPATACVAKCDPGVTRNAQGVCPAPAAPDTNHTITLSQTAINADKATFEAKIDNGSTVPTGYSYKWYREGEELGELAFAPATRTAAVTPGVTTTNVGAENNSPTDQPAAPTQPAGRPSPPPDADTAVADADATPAGPPDPGTGGVTGSSFLGNQAEITALASNLLADAPRHATKDYQICIRLIKPDRSIANFDCKPVPKKAAVVAPAAPRGNSGMGAQMPQMGLPPTRGGASDAVFRGIR